MFKSPKNLFSQEAFYSNLWNNIYNPVQSKWFWLFISRDIFAFVSSHWFEVGGTHFE